MTTQVVADEILGVLGRKYNDLFRRVRDGSLPPDLVLKGMQDLIEGRFSRNLQGNLDCDPLCPEGWTIESHMRCGEVDTAKIDIYLVDAQKTGEVKGTELQKLLESQLVLNACVLDYLLANPHLIPESWKGRHVLFWGTVYRNSGGHRVVRFLYWNGSAWSWNCRHLRYGCNAQHPAAVLAA